MLKRVWLYSTLALVALVVLGACGGDDGDDREEGAATPTLIPGVALAPQEEPEEEEGGEAEGGEGGEAGGEGGAGGGGGPVGEPVPLEAIDIAWNQTTLTVPVGGVINLVNLGDAEHNFAIVGYNEDAPVDMPIDGTVVPWTVPADLAPGEYEYYCAVPGHRALMTGTLTVTEGGAAPVEGGSPPAEGGATPAEGGAPAAAPAGGAPAAPVQLEAIDIAWSTNELTLPVGGTLTLVNQGAAQHNFVVEGYNDDAPVDMPVGGEPVTWTVPPELTPGTYTYICAVPGHEALMTGTLTIT